MIKKIIAFFVLVAITATVAYQMGWLSRKGEKVYDATKESIMEKGEDMIDKGKDALK
ncbi:hypothetical protein [Kaarinaea lacus]